MTHITFKFWLMTASAAIAILLLGSVVATGQTPAPENEKILSGVICADSRDCPPALHVVKLIAGRTYAIDVASADFNTCLKLEDMSGKCLATDMDYDDDLSGIIMFTPATTGEYRLTVANKNASVGYYHVRVREMPMLMDVVTELTPNDPVAHDAFMSVHSLTMFAGRRYVIDMKSDEFASFLKVQNPEGTIVAFADECDGARTTRVVFTPTRTATYFLVATSNDPAAVGSFRLTACEE